MESNPRGQLVRELEDLLTMRLAMVLVPALEALDESEHEDLAQFLTDFGMDLRGDLEWLLARFEIRK